MADEVRCARANGFPVVMLHATPDNDDGCEFSRFFGVTSSDIPTHVHVTLEPPFPPIPPSHCPRCHAPCLTCVCVCARATAAETTPQELISDGLYTALALAWYTDPFRQVSSK